MADVTPNYMVEQQRLRSQIAAQRSTIEGQKLAILEMADRKVRHMENIQAAEREVAKLEEKLTRLQADHGELTSGKVAEMIDSLEVKHG